MTQPKDELTAKKILVQHALNAALIDKTVPAQKSKRTNGRLNGETEIIQVPVSFTGPLQDGITIPTESASTLQDLLSQTLSGILPHSAFSIQLTDIALTNGHTHAGMPLTKLTVNIPDYSQVDTARAGAYIKERASQKAKLTSAGAHYAKVLHTAAEGLGIF